MAAKLAELGVDIMEAGFPIASAGDFEAVRKVGREVAVKVAALARATTLDVERAAKALEGAKAAAAHPRLSGHQRHPPQVQAEEDARAGARRGGGGRRAGAQARRRRRVLRRGRRAHAGRVPDRRSRARSSRPARRRSTSPTPSGTASPRSTARSSGRSRARWASRPSSASTATTISGWRSPTRSPPSRTARARSSARSTGSASAPATARSRRSSWSLKTRADRLPFATGIRTEQLFPASQLLTEIIGVGVQPNKAIVGAQRLRARGGHPPGRLPQGAHDLRDHRAEDRRRAREPPRAGQAQRPARAQGSLQGARPGARQAAARRGLRPVLRAGRSAEGDHRRRDPAAWPARRHKI